MLWGIPLLPNPGERRVPEAKEYFLMPTLATPSSHRIPTGRQGLLRTFLSSVGHGTALTTMIQQERHHTAMHRALNRPGSFYFLLLKCQPPSRKRPLCLKTTNQLWGEFWKRSSRQMTAIHTDEQTGRHSDRQTDRQMTMSTVALSIIEKKKKGHVWERVFLKRLFCIDFYVMKRKTCRRKETLESMGVGVSMRQPFGNQSQQAQLCASLGSDSTSTS